MFLAQRILEEKLLAMLAEDLGEGDLTTATTVPVGTRVEAEVISKEQGVIAGIEESTALLTSLGLNAKSSFNDGDDVKAGQVVMKITGDARTILSAERTVLNLLSRMSGIATSTRRLVKKMLAAKLKTRVSCTRKVAPGLLYFDKKAVVVGGGDSHRVHLDDMILIKSNHITIAGSLQKALRRAKQHSSFSKKIEVEVATAAEAVEAARAGVDLIMLDNFSPDMIEEATLLLRKHGFLGKVLIEVSGGITYENILSYASKSIDIVSLGELTASPRALDMNLRVRKIQTHES
jgi:nicotinate-nucleotide pyrophosphorylase (carboxylating)